MFEKYKIGKWKYECIIRILSTKLGKKRKYKKTCVRRPEYCKKAEVSKNKPDLNLLNERIISSEHLIN